MGLRPAIIGPFGPPQLACIRSWRAKGLETAFVHISSTEGCKALKRYVGHYHHLNPGKLDDAYEINQLAGFLSDVEASGITCVADNLALWLHDIRGKLPHQLEYWIPTAEVINELDSKLNQLDFAQKAGFDILPTWLIELGTNVETIGAFPVVARPDTPSCSNPTFKVQLLNKPAEYQAFLGKFQSIDRPLVIQPLITGSNIVIHGYRSASSRQVSFHGFIVEYKYEGVTLALRSIVLPETVTSACKKFCELIDIVGCFHFELIEDASSGRWYFLEINGRLGGTTAKALQIGYDEPYTLCG